MAVESLETLKKNALPGVDAFNALLKKIDFLIDKDYLDFIKEHNGAEGFLSDDNFILFWNVEDLIALNPYYKHDPESNNYFFFGSDGSSLGYAFDKINNNVVAIDFYEFGTTKPKRMADSFKLFIDRLTD